MSHPSSDHDTITEAARHVLRKPSQMMTLFTRTQFAGLAAMAVLLCTTTAAHAEGETELRVYVAGRDRAPVDLRGLQATVIVEPEGGSRRVVRLTAVTPPGQGQRTFEHGGDVLEAGDNHLVQLVVMPPAPSGHGGGGHGHGGHDDHGQGGDQGHGGHSGGGHDHGGGGDHGAHGHGAQPDVTPYLSGLVDLRAYSCGMTGHPITERPGECQQCGMQLQQVQRPFTAVVTLRAGGRTVNARGFRYPSDTPTSYADGLDKIQAHIDTIDRLIAGNQLLRVHPIAERISRVCEGLPEFAPTGRADAVRTTCRAIVALFRDIDEAADNERRADTVRVLDQYKARLAELRGHLPAR